MQRKINENENLKKNQTSNEQVAKNDITELVFILDKSGSMEGMEKDTIGGFNSMIAKQREVEGRAYVSTVLFANRSEVLHDRKDLNDIKPLTDKDYSPYGGTALLDAIGGAISHIGNIHKYARPEDVPSKTIFVITTDGMENASYKYSSSTVKKMIERQKSKYGWEFLFVAANIDAVETAEDLGIARDRAANYNLADSNLMYCSLAHTIEDYRKSGTIKKGWEEELEATLDRSGK